MGYINLASAPPLPPCQPAPRSLDCRAVLPDVCAAAIAGPGHNPTRPQPENLATLSPRLIVFVIAMAGGMALYEAWQRRQRAAPGEVVTATADG